MGLPAALVVSLVFWRGRRASGLILLAVVSLVIILLPLSFVLPRLGDVMGDTAEFRKHLWFSSVELVRERPLTGVGLDQFLYWYRSRYLLPEAWEEPNLSLPHNIILNHWVSLGILGVLVGVALQGWFWRRLSRLRHWAAQDSPGALMLIIGLAGSMADFLAHGLVDVGYFAINLAFVFFLSVALLQHLDMKAAAAHQPDRSG